MQLLNQPTCFGVLCSGLGGPWTSLDVASLLQSEHKASIANHDLASVETLQDSLRKWIRVLM